MSHADLNSVINEAIGRATRVARTAKGLTLVELSLRVGCSQPELTRLERGQQTWSGPMVFRVAGALEVPVDMLFPPPGHAALLKAS